MFFPLFRSVPHPPLTPKPLTQPAPRSSQAYYKFASPAEIKELMLWVYPPKEEEVVEQRKLSDAQKAEIKSIFVLYDANNNGLLEKKELFEALTASGYDDEEIEEMFEEYDQDGSHAIDFDEFCAMLESSYLDS